MLLNVRMDFRVVLSIYVLMADDAFDPHAKIFGMRFTGEPPSEPGLAKLMVV
jgi:hypothetical protein